MKILTSKLFNKNKLAIALMVTITTMSSGMGVAFAKNTASQLELLSKHDTQEVLDELSEEMAEAGFKVSFPKLPNMSYNRLKHTTVDDVINYMEEDESLTENNQPLSIKDLQQMLTMEGITISNFKSLQLTPISQAEMEQLEISQEAKEREKLMSLAKQMRNASSANKAQSMLEAFYTANPYTNWQATGNSVKVLSKKETKDFLDALTMDIQDSGYKITYTTLPTITIEPSKSIFDISNISINDGSNSLTSEQKNQLIDDIKEMLAMDGFSVDFNDTPPVIESIAFEETAFAKKEAQFQNELNKLSQKVRNSSNLDSAINLLVDFEQDMFEDELNVSELDADFEDIEFFDTP